MFSISGNVTAAKSSSYVRVNTGQGVKNTGEGLLH